MQIPMLRPSRAALAGRYCMNRDRYFGPLVGLDYRMHTTLADGFEYVCYIPNVTRNGSATVTQGP